MRLRYRLSTLLGVAAVMATAMIPLGARAVRPDAAMLKKIASRVDERAGVVTIEASDPVPYVASQPDPSVLLLELRDVKATGFTDLFKPDPRNPVAAVQVESAHSVDGADVARVRLTLSRPMRPRVRSSRNVITVEADRPENGVTSQSGMISMAGPAAAIRDLQVTKRGGATAISLLGTGRLVATSVHEETKGSRRLVIDLPNVTSSMKTATAVKQGPIDSVRIGLSPKSALVTQVVMEMNRAAQYRIESAPDSNNLTVVFDEPVADPIAALRTPPAASAATTATTATAVTAVMPVTAPVVTSAPAARLEAPAVPAARPAAPMRAAQNAAGQDAPAPSKYSGHPVSLDFQGADLRAVLRTFAEISGLNIVIDPSVAGSVDVALRDVPWDQALDIILRANKLGYSIDGTIVRVAPLTILSEEEKQRLQLMEAQALAGELRVLTRTLSYAKGEDVMKLLKDTVLSSRGMIQMDPRTNTLIINDLPDFLQRSADLVTVLDVAQPQVEIEARIVETSRSFARSLGVQWGFNASARTDGNALRGTATGAAFGVVGNPAVALFDTAAPNGLAVGLAGIVDLDVALSALENQGQGRILSTPRVSTQNNIEAEITQGIQIPIQTVANNTVTVTFKDAALTLKVKPQITAANTVIMQIAVENASPDFSRQVNNIPPIDTQRANTRVQVNNGETTVIGGIYKSREQTSQDRTPGLHRVPLLGWLFKRDTVTDENRELLIFITPKIARL
jgi:type IV pilus assembly protein PilQ